MCSHVNSKNYHLFILSISYRLWLFNDNIIIFFFFFFITVITAAAANGVHGAVRLGCARVEGVAQNPPSPPPPPPQMNLARERRAYARDSGGDRSAGSRYAIAGHVARPRSCFAAAAAAARFHTTRVHVGYVVAVTTSRNRAGNGTRTSPHPPPIHLVSHPEHTRPRGHDDGPSPPPPAADRHAIPSPPSNGSAAVRRRPRLKSNIVVQPTGWVTRVPLTRNRYCYRPDIYRGAWRKSVKYEFEINKKKKITNKTIFNATRWWKSGTNALCRPPLQDFFIFPRETELVRTHLSPR